MFFNNISAKKAFTIAEMLIVLSIISVIATLSLKALNNNINEKTMTMNLQKSYEDISKAVANGIVENGSMDYWDFTLDADKFISTYMHTLLNRDTLIVEKNKMDDRINLVVDINGNKKPNSIGTDRFPIDIIVDGTVLLPTWKKDAAVDKTTKTRADLLNGCETDGYWCGALIQKDGWKIKKDYPDSRRLKIR